MGEGEGYESFFFLSLFFFSNQMRWNGGGLMWFPYIKIILAWKS